MSTYGDPSVEEILESIKKVIARDSEARAQGLQRRRGLIAGGAEPADAEEAEDVLDLGAPVGEDFLIEGNAGLDAVFGEEPSEDELEDVSLIADTTRSAMQQNFAALTMLSRPSKQPQIVRQGETSLEGMVREMLRPMLANWLDEHLPAMVEELVKAEIARIAGKKR